MEWIKLRKEKPPRKGRYVVHVNSWMNGWTDYPLDVMDWDGENFSNKQYRFDVAECTHWLKGVPPRPKKVKPKGGYKRK